jgi:SAM-dependent methyltransferase
MNDVSLLRAHANRKLRALPARGLRVVELGGRRDGAHAALFRANGCSYLALGFEGDVEADLRAFPLALPDASADLVLISMVLMYFDDPSAVAGLVAECRRILAPGGRLVIIEPYLYGETSHKHIADCVHWSAEGMRRLVAGQGFSPVTVERLGGAAGTLLAFARDLLPGFLRPLRWACTALGARLDAAASRVPYFARRNARSYVGHFTVAVRP